MRPKARAAAFGSHTYLTKPALLLNKLTHPALDQIAAHAQTASRSYEVSAVFNHECHHLLLEFPTEFSSSLSHLIPEFLIIIINIYLNTQILSIRYVRKRPLSGDCYRRPPLILQSTIQASKAILIQA